MVIRPAQPDDLDAVQTLLNACGLPTADLTPAHLDHFLVAWDGDALNGVVGLEPRGDVALLRSLAVAPGARQEGIGTRLVRAVEQRATDDEVRALYLLTTTAADYFRGHGYAQIDRGTLPDPLQRTDEAARLCPSTAVCMRKTLRATAPGA